MRLIDLDAERRYLLDARYFVGTKEDIPTWIPCSERLPEYDGAYLATIKGRKLTGEYTIIVDLAYRFKHTWSHDYGIADILAWMPLPMPYKEGE